jgi:hypothetical protein
MKKINLNLYKIEEGDKQAAQDKNWNNTKNTFIGNLAELAACSYLGIEWPSSDGPADITDDFGTRYQIKGTQEGFRKKRYWLEQKKTKQFDRYIFVMIDEEERFAKIEMDTIKQIPHLNSHSLNNLKAIVRK